MWQSKGGRRKASHSAMDDLFSKHYDVDDLSMHYELLRSLLSLAQYQFDHKHFWNMPKENYLPPYGNAKIDWN